jgi:hypothetical protein
MLADLPAPLLLFLHEGGWDEILMVAVGLGIAYLVIVWTGRKNRDDDDEDDDLEDGLGEEESADAISDAATSENSPPSPSADEAPHRRS